MESNRNRGQGLSRSVVAVLAVVVVAGGGGAEEDIILKFRASAI